MDYDFLLRNSSVVSNEGDGLSVPSMSRRLVISESSFQANADNGIKIADGTFGIVNITNCVAENNVKSGFLSFRNYGGVMIDQSVLKGNGRHGIFWQIYINSYHTYHVSVTNSSVTDNGDHGVYLNVRTCSGISKTFLSDCSIARNKQIGLKVHGCGQFGSLELSSNVFYEHSGVVIDLGGGFKTNVINNTIYNNTGVEMLRWQLPYYHSEVHFKNNTFEDNCGDAILHILQTSSTNGKTHIKGNLFKNNTAFTILLMDNSNNGGNFVEVSENIFMDNVPKPFHPLLTPLIPIATVAFDNSFVDITENYFVNPLFPLELIASCQRFGKHLNATMNYWGNITEAEIKQRIYDFSDKYEFCTAHYSPFFISSSQEDAVLSNITRSYAPFNRGNTIGGVVQGTVTLSNTGNDYYVDRDIIIPHEGKLIIEPGVNLRFTYFASIFAQGELVAIGTSGNEIVMDSYYENHSSATVRLVDGTVPWEGRIEILFENTWHRLCMDLWSTNNARVICRQLGFVDFENSRISVERGNGPILPYLFNCVGTEIALEQCKQLEDEYCSYYERGIRCDSSGWRGIVFPLDSGKSILKHVTIRRAGYISAWPNQLGEYSKGAAVLVHFNHHEFYNVRINAPAAAGFNVFYKDPLYEGNILSSVHVEDCDPGNKNSGEYGIRLHYQGDITLHSCNIFNCYRGIDAREETITSNWQTLAKYINDEVVISKCNFDTFMDINGLILLAPPLDSSRHSCSDNFTTEENGRFLVSVLYNRYYSIIKVEESGNITFTYADYVDIYDFRNGMISAGNTISVHRLTTYYTDYKILIKAVPGE